MKHMLHWVRAHRLAALLLGVGAMALSSCTASNSKMLAPVAFSGSVVSADGKPVADLVISFHPQEAGNAGNRPSAALDKDGKFKLDGIPGRYKVTLAPIPRHHGSAEATGELTAAPAKGSDPKKAAKGVPARYLDAQSSPWDVTIPPE